MCRCDKTDKIISGMFVYICLAIASTIATVVIVEWLYINPLKAQQNQNPPSLSHNHTDLFTTTDSPILLDLDLPLILNVTHSEQCIKECALIFLAESTVHYVNSTCFCLTIAKLNELQNNEITSEEEPWFAVLPNALSLNDTGRCLMPGAECSSDSASMVCCDSAKGGDTQCLFEDYASNGNGTMLGNCCVKNSAFGCAHSDDCCSATRQCYHGFCLRPQETPDAEDGDGEADTEHATQYDPGAAIAVPLMMLRDEAGEVSWTVIVAMVMVVASVGALCVCVCFGCRKRCKGVGDELVLQRDGFVFVEEELEV